MYASCQSPGSTSGKNHLPLIEWTRFLYNAAKVTEDRFVNEGSDTINKDKPITEMNFLNLKRLRNFRFVRQPEAKNELKRKGGRQRGKKRSRKV